MSSNLTTKQIKTWKNSVDSAISKKLVTSLKKINTVSTTMSKVTSSTTEANLSYRFNDLAKVTNQAAKQLSTFMTAFDTSLTSYITTVQKAENTAAEKLRKRIDQFAEAAAEISKLKM